MPRCAARTDINSIDGLNLLGGEVEFIESYSPSFKGNPTANRIDHGAGLFVNFLEHEVTIAALFSLGWGPIYMLGGSMNGIALKGRQFDTRRRQDRHFTFVHKEHIAGVTQQGWHIAGQIHLAIAVSHNQRARILGGHNFVWLGRRDHSDGITAFNVRQCRPHRCHQIKSCFQFLTDEMTKDFCICLAAKDMASFFQSTTQLNVVLDDTVVNNGDWTRRVWVRILLRRPAMGCPTGMSDAQGTGQRRFF